MEKEIAYDLGNGMLQLGRVKDTKESEIILEKEMELELESVVCIFTSPDKPGIMFFDKTPSDQETKVASNSTIEEYITDLVSISTVTWDKKVHVANDVRYFPLGTYTFKVTTIIVTKEKMEEIISEISKSKDKSRIVIKTGRNKKYLYEKQMNNIDNSKVNYDNFNNTQDDIIKLTEQYNQFDNDDPTFNNFDPNSKRLR